LLSPSLDVFMLWGEPLAGTANFMARVRKAAGIQSITFSLSTRPILADTEDKAWNRAQDILARVTARTGGVENPNNCVAENVGSQRLLAAAAAGDVHGTCLWTKLAAAAGARGNSTALVGTPDTIAKAMVEYYKLGATSLLIRGYDPRPDAIQFGKELIPRVRELVSVYDAGTA
jgi:alkanesulfonate monooxygenase